MENWWISWQMSKVKQKDLLRDAARFRLLREDSSRPDTSRRRGHRHPARRQSLLVSLRCNLGQHLIDWGTTLRQDGSPAHANGVRTG